MASVGVGAATRTAVRIVRLQAADAGACVALELAAFDPTERFPARVWRRFLGPCQEAKTAIVLGIWAPRQVLAAVTIALVRRNSRVVRIYFLAVDPGCRGRGYGATLIAAIARRTGGNLSLEVRLDNTPARTLYERLGFIAGELLPNYYPDGTTGLRYRRAHAEKK